MFGEVFNNEIKLKEDECCIVFDFGCYYPYEDAGNSTYIEMYVSLKGTATLSEDEVINVIKEFVIQ